MLAGMGKAVLPLAAPVVFFQASCEVPPTVYRPRRLLLLGLGMPLQVAVTLPPATMLVGLTLRLAPLIGVLVAVAVAVAVGVLVGVGAAAASVSVSVTLPVF